jgi:hypothetical protein
MSFKCEVLTANDPKWYTNALRFETAAEAEQYGLDLILRWTGSRDYRATECADPVNYKIIDNKIARVSETGARE